MTAPEPVGHTCDAILGREAELKALTGFLGHAFLSGGTLLVTGEAGLGKTALLDVIAGRAARKARVLRAPGCEFETGLSYAGLHLLLLPVAEEMSRLAEADRAALGTALGSLRGEPPGRLPLTGAMLSLVDRLTATAPLLLVVDDVQWMDRASVVALSLVARRLGGRPCGLLLSQRTGYESFFDARSVPEIVLGPLDDDAGVRLLRRYHPDLHASVRNRVLAEAGGNPLALIELPRALTIEQETGAEVLPPTLPLSVRLRRIFESRVARLSQPTRRLLLLAALAGERGTRLMEVVADAASDLAPAESEGLVVVDRRANRLRFVHPLIRSAVVGLSTEPERRAAHRRLARLATDPDIRTLHLAESALGPDAMIAAQLVAVAGAARERGDATQAVSVLLRAADLTPDAPGRARLLTEAAYIGANVTGTLAGAGALLERALATDPAVTSALRASAAAATHLLNADGDIDTAHKLLTAALDAVDAAGGDTDGCEEVLQTLMWVCVFGGRPELWEPFDEAIARLAPLLSQPFRMASRTFTDPVRSIPGQLRELEAMTEAADRDANPQHVVMVAVAGHYVDRIPRKALEQVAAGGLTGRAVALAAQALIMLAVDAFLEGRWQQAGTYADEGIALCEENGYDMLLWGAMNPRLLLAAARADDDVLVAARVRMHQWAIPRNALAVPTFTANIEGLAALSQARYQEAYERFTSISPLGTFPAHERVLVWAFLDAVEAAVHSGHIDEARAHVRAGQAQLAPISPRLRFLCDGGAALVADDDAYAGLFEPLVTDPAAMRWPFPLARLELSYGERLRRDRAMRAARPHLERALELFTDLDASPWAERSRTALLATGRSRRRGREEGTVELTPQELQIARLAATGLTNRQIGERLYLSPRTVGAHLYRIFPKLGISSRAALRDALTERGDSGDIP